MTSPLFIGIDAGGTKTAWIRRSESGTSTGTAPGIHLLRDGHEEATRSLRSLIDDASEGAHVSGVGIGIAGAGREADRAALEIALSSQLNGVQVRVVHDAEIALQAAWNDESGVVLVVGTGSCLFARDEEGHVHRAGGWGWRVGDDGSGTSLGRAAARIALAALDGGPPSSLTEAFAEEGLDSGDAIREAIYVAQRPLSTFAPLLVEAAAQGDWQAEHALMRETNALGQQAGWLATRLGDGVTHRLALTGGLTHVEAYDARIVEALERHLPGWTLLHAEHEPVEGAVRLAETLVAA